jgi:CheY-like chemotaxis protein
MLLRLGYTVLEAAGVESAQRLIVEHDKPIQLLVTDIVMPRLSGLELARQLTAQRPGLKAMFISGYADDSMEKDGLLEPGSAFLRKPFTADALAAKIREVLDA